MQHFRNKKRLLIGCVLGLAVEAPALDLLYGHYELHTDYTPEEGWWMGVSYNQNNDFNDRSQIRRLDPEATIIVAPPVSKKEITSAVSFMGEVGEPLWLLPQSFEEGNHFLGMRIIIDPQIFKSRVGDNYSSFGQGSVGIRLLDVSGTGPDRGGAFALWENEAFGGNLVYFNSADGIDENDDLPILPVGAHSHFAWGFTQPGSYAVEFEAYGQLRSGEDTSIRQTINFQIPHDGLVTSCDLSLLGDAGNWALMLKDEDASVAYGDRRATVLVSEEVNGNWEVPFTIDAAGWSPADRIALSETLAASGAATSYPEGVELRLVGHEGPGDVSFTAEDITYYDSSNGLDEADSLSLGDTTLSGHIDFTAEGIHWLSFQAMGTSQEATTSQEPLRIRFLVNLAADYDYAAWADSKTRMSGLSADALDDPLADYEGDGHPNWLEYFMDAAGASPFRSEELATILPEDGDGYSQFIFFRDLYQDPLDTSLPRFGIDYSSLLSGWSELSPANPGFPLQVFETGYEMEGNARSRFMLRSLRIENSESTRQFYRFNYHDNAN
ncbi:MAG: choice-of-anchor M domain-containing protein [Verrucomicrobiota bacterium JB023]|nr:choice-of-anchor M domain-containing protein [Verrucomicrobiota bacterium JB023]